jgi:hypothetical protein
MHSQLGDAVLGQAGIRAGGAGLGAFEAGGDALGQFLPVDPAADRRPLAPAG